MLQPVFRQRPRHVRVKPSATPLAVYEQLYAGDTHAFLYESLETDHTRGRYSFVGGRPRLVFRSKGRRMHFQGAQGGHEQEGDPFAALKALIGPPLDAPPIAPLPGGAVGYIGYDMVRFCERLPDRNPDDRQLPDSYFIFPEELVVFDHLAGDVHLLVYDEEKAQERLERLQERLTDGAVQDRDDFVATPAPGEVPLLHRSSEAEFKAAVDKAKEYIHAGDIFQVVLSQRFEFALPGNPLTLYKALRRTNPSPYMYFLNLDGLHVLGSSPEILVKRQGEMVTTRPLAGTRPRGLSSKQDEHLARELLADEKERAEHVMLVDLARNDLGRVCVPGSVKIAELMRVERYAQVMHLVSHLEGRLDSRFDAVDVLRAALPAGTVSGAPKVRAMEIIEELEPVKRGIYAGGIGYFSVTGDMDMCIAIRTMVAHGGRGFIQVGAGVVADSVPQREYEETLHKAAALVGALSFCRTVS